ncbi:MAG: PAS domain-containing protein [Kiloniellales bacterium]
MPRRKRQGVLIDKSRSKSTGGAGPKDWRDLLAQEGVYGDESFLARCHPDIATVYRLWDERRGGRAMPSRADFDPVDMPRHVLPGVLLVDVESEPRRFRYRLVGTRDVDRRGHDPTGLDVTEGYYGPDAERALETYGYVAATARPLYRSDTVLDNNHVPRDEERLFLPLGSDGKTVDMILVFVVWQRLMLASL